MHLMHLYLISYILLCVLVSSLAVRNFRSRLTHLANGLGFASLLVIYTIILAALTFFLAVVFAILSPSRLFTLVSFVAAQLFFVLPATLLIFAVIIWLAKPRQLSPRSLSILSSAFLIVALLFVGTYIYAHFIEPYRLQTTFLQVHSDKLANLESPLRIVLLTDIQSDQIGDYEQSVFQRTLDLKPDLILFAGDYIQCLDSESYRLQADLLAKMLNELSFNAPLGVFAVLGDCEPRNRSTCFDNTAIQWLNDRTVTIAQPNAAIRLSGLSLETGASLNNASPGLLSSLKSATFNIVLSHRPDFALDLPPGHNIDLCLAGHIHGGQIRLPFVGPLITFSRIPHSKTSGSHKINGTRLVVSRGIGMERGWAPRLRFLCPPQIMVVDLTPN